MKAQQILNDGFTYTPSLQSRDVPPRNADSFRTLLDGSYSSKKLISTVQPLASSVTGYQELTNSASYFMTPQSSLAPRKELTAAYKLQEGSEKPAPPRSDWEKYKDDQLLRNPGGDNYDLNQKKVLDNSENRKSFLGRVGKNLADVAGNVKNFFGNLFMGAKFNYRDENNTIKESTTRGLVGTCVDFVKDLGSALSFGLMRPAQEKEPQGFMERINYAGSKLKKAVLGDLMEGVPQSVNHMAKNVALAGWNLVQVVPDATIGNFDEGRKLTTTIFDNGQVMVEYLTDIIPSGDAWFRVHAASLDKLAMPVLFNLQQPETSHGDSRWQYVKNTPFRKTIETIGTLLADITSIGLIGQTCVSTNQSSETQNRWV